MAYQQLVRDWDKGVVALEKGNLDTALEIFRGIKNPPSKIDFNIGCLYLQQGNLDQALEAFDQTLSKDNCLAVGFFQRSYVHLQLGRYEEALKDGKKALCFLGNNSCINYKQIGLAFVLCASEVLHNMAAAHCQLGSWHEAREALEEAAGQMPQRRTAIALKQVEGHLFLEPQTVPPGKIFRPPLQAGKLKEKDYLGQSKIISSAFEEGSSVDASHQMPQITQGIPPPPEMTPPGLLHENQKSWMPGEREGNEIDSKNPKSECLPESPPVGPTNDGFYLKVHSSFVVNQKFEKVPSLAKLRAILQEEYRRQVATLKVRYKASGSTDFITINSDGQLMNLCQDAQRNTLTLWCQGEEVQADHRPVLYRMVGRRSYTSDAPEDLNFKDGEVLEILSEVNEEWLEGRCNGMTGIFPKLFAAPECPAAATQL
ncbi:NADPH oxidase activator 1 isoform X2 [Pantherophis guttatus]|uniref:NADPH oxidase activator 1 isoform X2 n=1 Tax=Pantherophis guttatus TaxID=94885 RepID=A0ABM3YZP8_PANGU|nr:NADPH oxidase activator 1 isoform X2 [Pantherophis guttatus]